MVIRRIVLLVTLAGSAGSVLPVSALEGFWEHDRCQTVERDGARSGSRSLFAFFDREWGIAFTQYADEACHTKVLTAALSGTYDRTAPSSSVPGAFEVTFRFSRKTLVVYDPSLIARLNAGACGKRRWRAGVEQDVTTSGCLSIESIVACSQEYDLVKIEDDRLYLGERPRPGENICAESRRPQRLRTISLVRR